MAKGAGSPSRERGKRAGANARPTPLHRLVWPKALETRLQQAGCKTRPFEKTRAAAK